MQILKPKHPIHALIFDMDGTMIDSMPYHAQSWQAFIDQHGLTLSNEELLARTTGRTGIECMRLLLGQDISDAQAVAFLHEKEALYRQLFAPVFKPVAGFHDFLAAAQQRGLLCGGGTAGDIDNVRFAMSHLKLQTPLLTIVRGDEGLAGKPNPDIFLEAARRMGVAPAHCIVFEDAPFGIEAARRAGMHAVGITTGHSASELSGEHVLCTAPNYTDLMTQQFLEQLA